MSIHSNIVLLMTHWSMFTLLSLLENARLEVVQNVRSSRAKLASRLHCTAVRRRQLKYDVAYVGSTFAHCISCNEHNYIWANEHFKPARVHNSLISGTGQKHALYAATGAQLSLCSSFHAYLGVQPLAAAASGMLPARSLAEAAAPLMG